MVLVVKNMPANVGDAGLIPGSGRSPGEENGNPLQYFCLKNPMDRGAWQGMVHKIAKSRTRLKQLSTRAACPEPHHPPHAPRLQAVSGRRACELTPPTLSLSRFSSRLPKTSFQQSWDLGPRRSPLLTLHLGRVSIGFLVVK